MPRRPTFLCALACALGLLPAATAAARTGPCFPQGGGPTCQIWTGHVTSINDGDTVAVDIDGDGTHHSYAIRFNGIQAMEQTRYSNDPRKRRGQCHALQATNLVQKLVRQAHGRVRLTAQAPRTDSRGRLFRTIAVRIGGHWVDVGSREMAAGATIWMHANGETAWNRTYNRLGQEAALKHIGMWDTTTCGVGPDQDVPLKAWVMSDPLGDDPVDLNNEWVKIENLSATRTVSLARWWVRDSGLRRYTFPLGAAVRPGETVTVHVGSGTNTATDFYWGQPATVFENSANGGDVGDGGYLFDPQGDLRAWMVYPCLVACSDPDQGAIQVTAHPYGREYVLVRNVSGRSIDLYGYELRLPGGYAFPPGSVLDPGETMEVDVEGNPTSDTRRLKHMAYPGAYMPDSGGAAQVTTFSEIPLACDAWGNGHC